MNDLKRDSAEGGDVGSAGRDGITFMTDGLVSKWGFEDGDQLLGFMADNGYDVGRHSHGEFLVAAIRRFVLPRIDQRIEVE